MVQCEECAETCRLQLLEQHFLEELPTQKVVNSRKPQLQTSLIPMSDGHHATRYSDALYSSNQKMLTALGVNITSHDTVALPSEDTKILCDKALVYLLKKTEDCRAEYAVEFEGLLADKLNIKFLAMKSLVDNKLKRIGDT